MQALVLFYIKQCTQACIYMHIHYTALDAHTKPMWNVAIAAQ